MKIILIPALLLLVPLAADAQCSVENFIDFESGTNGGAITTVLMGTSTHGYGGSWTLVDSGGALTFGTVAHQPLSYPTGSLCGDSTNYSAGIGSKGMVGTGTGSAAQHNIQIALPAGLQLGTLTTSVWLCSDLAASDSTTNPDIIDIHSLTDFVAINYLGNGATRYVNLETGNGNGASTISISTGSCPTWPAQGGNWYRYEITLGHSGGIADSMKVFDTTGAQIGSTVTVTSINTGNATTSYLGAPGNPTAQIVAGKHLYFDSWQIAAVSTITEPNCSGSHPTFTCTPDQVSMQTGLNDLTVCNDTLNVLAGTVTWTSQLTNSPPTGCSAFTGTGNPAETISGATTCDGTPGVRVSACADNAVIYTTIDQNLKITGAGSASFLALTGFTVNDIATADFNGAISISGTHGQQSFRVHHMHLINALLGSGGGVAIMEKDGYGLNDHILVDDSGASIVKNNPFGFKGDTATRGYQNWNDATNPGSNEAIYVEDSLENGNTANGEGFWDGYQGCKVVVRYTTLASDQIGGGHGTDSGNDRGCVLGEFYHLTMSGSCNSQRLFNTRGGSYLFENNTVTASGCGSIDLEYFRYINWSDNAGQSSTQWPGWGAAGAGLNWTPQTTPPGASPILNSLNAVNWQATHSYTCSAGAPCIVGPTTNNAGSYNYQATANCTSAGGNPSPWNQTVGQSQSDNTCSWLNIGGTTAASPAGAGFLATNPDTACASGVGCTRFFDTNGGVYPFRDQPGRIHDQVLYGNYACNNSGGGLPSPIFVTDSETASIIQSGTDYFMNTCAEAAKGYAPYIYPHPLQGPAASASPAPCPKCYLGGMRTIKSFGRYFPISSLFGGMK